MIEFPIGIIEKPTNSHLVIKMIVLAGFVGIFIGCLIIISVYALEAKLAYGDSFWAEFWDALKYAVQEIKDELKSLFTKA